MDINMFKNKIFEGVIFQKVKGSNKIGAIHTDGFTYPIGSNGNYKKATYAEIANTIKTINAKGYINRQWHETTFHKLAESRLCNFTSISSVLQALGFERYVGNGRYNKVGQR